MKKMISILLVIMLILGMFPATTLTAFAADTYEKATSIAVGDTVVLVCESKKMEMSTIGTQKYGEGKAYSGTPSGLVPLTVEEGSSSGTYSFKTPAGAYLYWTSGNYLQTNGSKTANTSWTVTFSDGNVLIKNVKDSTRQIQWNATNPRFSAYTSTQTAIQLYKLSGGTTPDPEPECPHDNKVSNNDAQDPTCVNPGQTNSYTCSDCGETIAAEPLSATGVHIYEDGKCTMCGADEPVEPEAPVFPEIPETGNYKLITDLTEVLTGGQYVFVVEYEGNYYALGNEIADKIAPVETVVSGEYVYGTAPSWKVGSYDGGLVLFNGTKYLGHSSGANFTSAADPSKWIVQDNEDGTFLLISSADEERAVAYNYNSGNHRFGPYAVENLDNAQYALRLHIYKKVNDGATPAFKGILSFVENGKVTTATPAYGSSYALPDASIEAPTGYTFAGWVEAALKETTAAPETIHASGATITVPASKTYYALYTRSETTQGGETVKEYQKASSIAVGDTVVLVYETSKQELDSISTTKTKYGIGVNYSGVPAGAMPLTVVAGSGAAYAFKTTDNKYLYWSSGNSLNVNATLNANTSWNVTFDANGNAIIANGQVSDRKIFWNNSSPRFACYDTTAQKPVQLYVLTEVASGGSTTTTYYTTVVEDTCAHGSYASVNATTVACQYCGAEKAAPVNVGGVAYESIQKAAEAGIVVLNENIENVAITGELHLDLNGKTATNVTATKIYAYDSTVTITTTSEEFKTLTTTSPVEVDYTVGGKRYIALEGENNTYTFHILEMKLSAVSLRTTAAGIYYKAIVNCDDTLAGAVSQYGIALSTQDMPGADFATENEVNGWTVVQGNITSGQAFTSGSVFGIFKDDEDRVAAAAERHVTLDELNALYGEVEIYANAYIVVDGTTIMADTTTGDKATDDGFDGIAWSLKDVLVTLDSSITLTDAQKTQIRDFYDHWGVKDFGWELNNIASWSPSSAS